MLSASKLGKHTKNGAARKMANITLTPKEVAQMNLFNLKLLLQAKNNIERTLENAQQLMLKSTDPADSDSRFQEIRQMRKSLQLERIDLSDRIAKLEKEIRAYG